MIQHLAPPQSAKRICFVLCLVFFFHFVPAITARFVLELALLVYLFLVALLKCCGQLQGNF